MSLYDEIMALTPKEREHVLADLTPLSDRELESAYDEGVPASQGCRLLRGIQNNTGRLKHELI